jgi:hypothetical protein
MEESDFKEDSQLTERQRRTLPFLVSCKNIKEACREAKISHETYYAWLDVPAFRNELNRLRNYAMSEGLQQLRDSVTQASQKLIALLDSESEETRRKAACNILEFSLKIQELGELEERLVSIERIILEKRSYA